MVTSEPRLDRRSCDAICGDEHVVPTSTSCAPTSPTGCCSTRVVPARGGAARHAPRRSPPSSRACHARGRAVGGARLGLRPVRRRAARRGRRADRRSRGMRRILEVDLDNQRVVRRARRHQPRGLGGRRADPLLPARPLEPDRLLDRRQRGRELRRRALLQVRLHDQLRDRPGARAARRRRCVTVGGKELDPPGLRPARRVRRLRGHARRGHEDHGCAWSPRRRPSRTLVAFFDATHAAGEAVSDIVAGGRRARRDRDDGQRSRSRRPRRWPTPATRPTPARRWWSSSTAREARVRGALRRGRARSARRRGADDDPRGARRGRARS